MHPPEHKLSLQQLIQNQRLVCWFGVWGPRGECTELLLPPKLCELSALEVDQFVFFLGCEARPGIGPQKLLRLELLPPDLRRRNRKLHCLSHEGSGTHKTNAVSQGE